MSAFIVGDMHIEAMLQVVAPRYPGDGLSYYWNGKHHPFGGHHQEIGQILVDENVRSINYHYQGQEPLCRFRARMIRHFEPVEVIKACDCYSYQSCECPDWKETRAHAVVEALRERAISRLPGYDEAQWEVRV